MLQQLTSLLVATLLRAAPAGAQAPDGHFDPSLLKGRARGSRTRSWC